MPDAIIKIPKRQEFHNQQPVFEVLIKQDGKTIYHNKTYAVIMNLVQSITKLDVNKLEMVGDSQILGVGHPIIQLFALDQLNKKMRKSGVVNKAIIMLAQVVKHPELKYRLLEIMKRAGIKEEQL